MKPASANRLRAIVVLVLLMVFTASVVMSQCPEAPRNVEYSSNFYKAQVYFLEQNDAKGANLSVLVQGVPIGGSATSTNWSSQSAAITEEQAITYIKSELSNYRSQIVAEAAAVLCAIGRMPNPNPVQLRAIDAIERIASIALGYHDGAGNGRSKNVNFQVLPSNPFVFFKEGSTTNQTLLLTVTNLTEGQLNLVIDQPVLPDDFPWYTKFAEPSLEILLMPKEVRQLPFYVNYPRQQTAPYQASITIMSESDNSVSATSVLTIVPSEDFFQLPPEVLPGEIKTNARIKCTAMGHPDYLAEHSNWFTLPYNAGPNMHYAGQSSAYAITTASVSVHGNSKRHYNWSLLVSNKCGGMCGASNVGGHGEVMPLYRTIIRIPVAAENLSWVISIRGRGTGGTGATTVYVFGNGVDETFSFDRSGTPQRLNISDLKAGEYTLEIQMPKFEQGCYGAYPGTVGERTFDSTIDVEIVRGD